MDNNLFVNINEHYKDMSKGHKKIADYIINNYDKAAFMTAAKLGETVGISESTVVRFAMELNFEGYPALQQAIKEIMRIKLTSVQRIEVANSQLGNEDILRNVLNLDIENIRTTLENSDSNTFNSAVDAISKSKTIYIIGSRSAEMLARFLAYYLNLIFEDVRLLHTTGASELFQQLIHLSSEDTVIGISFPRYSKQTAKALQYASMNKSTVVAITDSNASPIAKYSNHVLLARSEMASFVDSLVAPLSLINALIVALGIKKSQVTAENFERLERIWQEFEVYDQGLDENFDK